jgi:GGDEF domain-containing protein
LGIIVAVGAWLCLAACAMAQEIVPPAPAGAPPVALHLADRPAELSLDLNSRYWVEPGGQRTIDEIERLGESIPWALRRPGQQYRLDSAALWLQFDATLAGRERWFLSMGTSGIDRAQFFYRDESGAWQVQEAGDTRSVMDWPLPGRVPTFELPQGRSGMVRYWVRVEHSRVDFASPLSLHSQASLLALREREQFLLGAYFGLAALIAFAAIAHTLVYRDRSFGAYALYVSLLAIGQVAYLGVGSQHLWTSWLAWNDTASYLLPGLSSAAGLWFVKTVTEPARFSRALDLAVWGLIAAILSAVALDTFLQTRATFALVMALIVASIVVIVGLIALVWVRGDDPHIRLVALGFLPVIVMAVFPVARGLNLIPASNLTRYGVSIGAVLEMPILLYALTLRGSRRREAQVRAAALSRNDALTGLANRRTFLHRLEDALARARSLKHPCGLLAVRISNYAALLEEFGQDAADKALVVAASHLRRAISDIDLAARVGEFEFALLLEGPTTASIAMARAQHAIAGGLRQSDALPPGMILKFHVAAALLPERDLDAGASLRWAVEGAATMAPDARKLIRPLNF